MRNIDKMTQVMLSLKSQQDNFVNNINALLSDDTALDLIPRIDIELGRLSMVQLKMQQCQNFILQMNKAEEDIKKEKK